MRFRDRHHAGQLLAGLLRGYAQRSDVIVLALPRGGVPVAFEIAQAIEAPLDVFMVHKLGVPGHPELAMGAVASGGVQLLNEDVVGALDIDRHTIERVTDLATQELERREVIYRGHRPAPDLGASTVVLVDDGLATGASMLAAIRALRRRKVGKIVVAVPVAPPDTCASLRDEADDCICLAQPTPFHAVGMWYEDFEQVSDAEVCDLLERARIGQEAYPP